LGGHEGSLHVGRIENITSDRSLLRWNVACAEQTVPLPTDAQQPRLRLRYG
jgi:hypothetical protein